jgi:hypothetical protein
MQAKATPEVQSLNDEIALRQINDGPFCWQSKTALTMIRNAINNEGGNTAYAIAVYVAVTELASDEQSETFSRYIANIARRAGVSYRTAAIYLKRLESCGLIGIERRFVEGSKERLSNVYTLRHIVPNPRHSVPRIEKNLLKQRKGIGLHGAGSVHDTEGSDQFSGTQPAPRSTRPFRPKYPYPESEKEMYETLEELGVDWEPDYDGNFYEQMVNNDWIIPGTGKPVYDWIATYLARLENNTTGSYY